MASPVPGADLDTVPEYLLNLLFLPLLGGYWFYQRFNLTAYRANRLPSQRLVFHAALCGLLLLVVSRALAIVVNRAHEPGPWHDTVLISVIPSTALIVFISTLDLARLLIWKGIRHWRKPADKSQTLRFGEIRETKGSMAAKSFFGLALAGILVWFAWSAGPGWFAAVTSPEIMQSIHFGFWIAMTLIVLVLVARWFHMSVTQYMVMPFSSFVFRISAFALTIELLVVGACHYHSDVRFAWTEIVPYESSAIPALACVLGLVVWAPLNLLYPFPAAVARLHTSSDTNSLERLFFRASNSHEFVLITLNDGKVYVGHLRYLPPHAGRSDEYIQILPWVSGYRNKDTHEVNFTTFYSDVYAKLLGDEVEGDDAQLEEFLKIIPVASVTSANVFDPDVYAVFVETSTDDSQSYADNLPNELPEALR